MVFYKVVLIGYSRLLDEEYSALILTRTSLHVQTIKYENRGSLYKRLVVEVSLQLTVLWYDLIDGFNVNYPVFQLYRGGQYPEKITDLSQVTD